MMCCLLLGSLMLRRPEICLAVSWTLRILPCLIIPFILGGPSVVTASYGPARKPNIIFIHADDLGWNDVSFHGYNEIPTPNIDRLAGEGVILNSYYTHYMCTPSRSAFMTGKYPTRTGLQHYVLRNAEPRGLPLVEKILPQYLKEAGYKTHLVGKWHLGYYQKRMVPTNRGFDSFFGYHAGMVDYYNYTSTAGVPPEWISYDLWDDTTPARDYIGEYATELLTKKAIDRINTHDYELPLFLYLSHLAPHYANKYDPVQVPQKYIDRFPNISHPGRKMYAAVVSALDDSIGKVVDALKVKGVVDNSIIVFSSDNGGAGTEQSVYFGRPSTFASNWPLRGAKSSQWDGGSRVVACIWSNLLEVKGRVSKELYHISDWLPTFIRLAGGSPVYGIDGMDIWDSISKGVPSPRKELLHQIDPVCSEYAYRWHQYKLIIGSHVNSNGYHIDKWYVPEGGIDPQYITDVPGALKCEDQSTAEVVVCDANAAPCLFDIEKDPCEYKNIALDRQDIVNFMTDKIKAFNGTALPSFILPLDPRGQARFTANATGPWED